MKKTLLLVAVFAFGFATKVGVVEVERLAGTRYIDQCFEERRPTTQEGETECYGAAKHHAPYQVLRVLNAQPSFWKNTTGRCVGTQGTKKDAYFECNWWNRFAI